jgi:hypothetical protein
MVLIVARHAAPATGTLRDKQTRFSELNKDKRKRKQNYPGFEFKSHQVNDSSQSNQGTDHLVSQIISSNRPGDVSSHPLLPGFFGAIFYCQPFCWAPYKSNHSLCVPLPPSISPKVATMSQSSNNRAMAIPCARRVYCPNYHVLTNGNRATT